MSMVSGTSWQLIEHQQEHPSSQCVGSCYASRGTRCAALSYTIEFGDVLIAVIRNLVKNIAKVAGTSSSGSQEHRRVSEAIWNKNFMMLV